MSNPSFIHANLSELKRLHQDVANDPIMGPQLKERIEEARLELERLNKTQGLFFDGPALPRHAAYFLRGEGVREHVGILPELAGQTLIQYDKMFVQQALHDEREEAKAQGRQRRPKGALKPSLLFTTTPEGSFGFEFVPNTEDIKLLDLHIQSLHRVADAVVEVATAESLTDITKRIPVAVLQPLKQFFKILATYRSSVRFAFDDADSKQISADEVTQAVDRLEKEVAEQSIVHLGVFRGATLETHTFDFKTDEGMVINGTLLDDLNEHDLERLIRFTNRKCLAMLQATTIRSLSGNSSPSYTLLEVFPLHPSEEPQF